MVHAIGTLLYAAVELRLRARFSAAVKQHNQQQQQQQQKQQQQCQDSDSSHLSSPRSTRTQPPCQPGSRSARALEEEQIAAAAAQLLSPGPPRNASPSPHTRREVSPPPPILRHSNSLESSVARCDCDAAWMGILSPSPFISQQGWNSSVSGARVMRPPWHSTSSVSLCGCGCARVCVHAYV